MNVLLFGGHRNGGGPGLDYTFTISRADPTHLMPAFIRIFSQMKRFSQE